MGIFNRHPGTNANNQNQSSYKFAAGYMET
jgi:hypothetical protein